MNMSARKQSILNVVVVVSGVACGAPVDQDADANQYLPRGVSRIDGDIELDHIFYDDAERDAYCADHPNSEACSELGVAYQPWVSAEYHGWDPAGSLRACYSPNNSWTDCEFPMYKQVKILFNSDWPTLCYPPGVPEARATTIINSFKAGVLAWNGRGAGVTVQDGTCSNADGLCQTLIVTCGDAGGSNFAVGGLSGSRSTRVADLPVGPHGLDQIRARVTATSVATIDIAQIYSFAASNCSGGATAANVATLAQYIGTHEMGHAFAFAHTTTGLMQPTVGCGAVATIPAEYANALGVYDSSGEHVGVSVVDRNLENYGVP